MPLFKSPVWRWGRFCLLAFFGDSPGVLGMDISQPRRSVLLAVGAASGVFFTTTIPPFHAWVQGLFAGILGRFHWVLRLPNLVSNLLLAVFYYRICRLPLRQGSPRSVLVGITAAGLLTAIFSCFWDTPGMTTGWSPFAVISSFWFVRFVDGYRQTGQGQSLYLYSSAFNPGSGRTVQIHCRVCGLSFSGYPAGG